MATWTAAKRKKYHEEHPENFAGPDMSYPIEDSSDVEDAWRLAGKADNPDAVRRKIKSIAKRLGLKLPKTAQVRESANAAMSLPVEIVESGGEEKQPLVMLIRAGTSKGVHGRLHYRPDVLMRESSKFEGLPVFDNHLSPKEEAEKPYRQLRDHLGYIREVSYDPTPRGSAPEGGLTGRLDIFPDQQWFRQRVQERPDSVEFSIRAAGRVSGTLPGEQVPILESFTQTKSLDAVLKGGAGGRILSIAEAAAEEVDMLLNDVSAEDLARHPEWPRIKQMVESYVSRDYEDDDKELMAWKNKMAVAKRDNDTEAHDKLLTKMPAYHRHDREECHLCNPKTRYTAAGNPPGTPAQVLESQGEESPMDDKQLVAAIREAVKEETKDIREQLSEMKARTREQQTRESVTKQVRESGLPTKAQDVLIQDILEAAADGLVPSDQEKFTKYLSGRVARMKTLSFAPETGARATGQGDPTGEVREGEGQEEPESEIAEALYSKLANPNIPEPKESGSAFARNMEGASVQVAEAAGQVQNQPRRRRQDAFDRAFSTDARPNVGLEA